MVKKKEITLVEAGVQFDAATHTYSLDGKTLQGITTTLVNRAYPKDETYAGISEDVLNKAAERGSACHQSVGNYYLMGLSSTGYEDVTSRAVELLDGAGLTPIAFEYIVTDFEHYASPIDIVCKNDKNEVCIVDMKFTSKLLWPQVTLQTTVYQRFFEIVNPDLQVKHLYVLWIHTNDEHAVLDSRLSELTPADEQFVSELIAEDIAGVSERFDITKFYGQLPATVTEVEDSLVNRLNLLEELKEEISNIKGGLCDMMLAANIKQYSSEKIQLTTVTPKPRETFDTTRFKKEHPDLYTEYVKLSEVKPSVRITIK
jgi:hypothetical protein